MSLEEGKYSFEDILSAHDDEKTLNLGENKP